jgi:Leucine-rich repeat (LRR) protein
MLLDSLSAQSRALEWIETHDYSNLSDEQVLQSWIMAGLAYSTGVEQWSTSSAWLDGVGQECSWYGVTCSVDSNRVSSIFLFDNGLSGNLLPELYLLGTSLEEFDVSQNQINGIVPSVYGRLSKLFRLELDRNRLKGGLPTQIGSMTSLKIIKLEFNQFEGELPAEMVNLLNLQEFTFFGNNLVGTVSQGLCDLLGLQILEADCKEMVCSCCTRCWYQCGDETGIPCNNSF